MLSVIITHQLISACSYWMKHVMWYNIRWRLCHFLSGLKAILEWAGYLDVNLVKVWAKIQIKSWYCFFKISRYILIVSTFEYLLLELSLHILLLWSQIFRTDLISAMKLPDHQNLSPENYMTIADPWRQEWERGVQVMTLKCYSRFLATMHPERIL